MIRTLTVAACLAGLSATAVAQTFEKPDFPRLAGVNIGAPFNYDDPTYQTSLSKLHFSILGMWPGFRPGGLPMETIVRQIKQRNPKSLVFLYVNNNELGDREVKGAAWDTYRAKMESMNWWLYPQGTSGTVVPSTYGSGNYRIINNTLNTPADSTGKRSVEWITHFFVDNYYRPNPSIDGFFMDNVFWKPRVSGDWNRDGTTESSNSTQAATWLRLGYQRYFTLAKSLMPGKIQLGNVADWGDADAVVPELRGHVQGGVMEGMIGVSYAPERWGSWNTMMVQYRKTMRELGEPKLAVFNQHGNPTDYQAFRYGFASCLLDDAYFNFTVDGQGYSGVPWFDEYDVQLGKALSTPSTLPWQNGVYRRDFEKGIVLVNPRGNGQRTLTLEAGFKRFAGRQAPSVNNGADVTSVTLRDRDGIVLVRKTVRAAPSAPQLIAVQ